eukprot:evm.model.scf_3035.3 EVM.evm.TU.scf_3035.3   scf_3035:10856-13299(-)
MTTKSPRSVRRSQCLWADGERDRAILGLFSGPGAVPIPAGAASVGRCLQLAGAAASVLSIGLPPGLPIPPPVGFPHLKEEEAYRQYPYDRPPPSEASEGLQEDASTEDMDDGGDEGSIGEKVLEHEEWGDTCMGGGGSSPDKKHPRQGGSMDAKIVGEGGGSLVDKEKDEKQEADEAKRSDSGLGLPSQGDGEDKEANVEVSKRRNRRGRREGRKHRGDAEKSNESSQDGKQDGQRKSRSRQRRRRNSSPRGAKGKMGYGGMRSDAIQEYEATLAPPRQGQEGSREGSQVQGDMWKKIDPAGQAVPQETHAGARQEYGPDVEGRWKKNEPSRPGQTRQEGQKKRNTGDCSGLWSDSPSLEGSRKGQQNQDDAWKKNSGLQRGTSGSKKQTDRWEKISQVEDSPIGRRSPYLASRDQRQDNRWAKNQPQDGTAAKGRRSPYASSRGQKQDGRRKDRQGPGDGWKKNASGNRRGNRRSDGSHKAAKENRVVAPPEHTWMKYSMVGHKVGQGDKLGQDTGGQKKKQEEKPPQRRETEAHRRHREKLEQAQREAAGGKDSEKALGKPQVQPKENSTKDKRSGQEGQTPSMPHRQDAAKQGAPDPPARQPVKWNTGFLKQSLGGIVRQPEES